MVLLADLPQVLDAAFAGRLGQVARDPGLCRHQCGPLTLAALRALRVAGYRCGAWFVTGTPGSGDETAHYVCVVRDDAGDVAIVDVAYRQFNPDTPWPLIYTPLDYSRWGWDSIETELFDDDPEAAFSWTYDCFDETTTAINEDLWELVGPTARTVDG